MIILVTGDFGVGKDTFADILLEKFGDSAQKIQSYTTRPPRYEGEDTHIFVTEDEWHNLGHKVAQTIIDGNYYGTIDSQFQKNLFNIYVVDDIGVRDVVDAKIDDIYLIEIIRPKWLIDVPEERLNRRRTNYFDYKNMVDYRVINDSSLEKLNAIAKDISLWLKIHCE